MTAPNRYTVIKDVTSYIGGWALLIYQVKYVDPSKVNEAFLWIAVGLIGVPSLAQLWSLRAGGAPGIGGSPSPPGPPPSPPPSSRLTTPSGAEP